MTKIVILCCNGSSPAAEVAKTASQELVLEARAEWCLSWEQLEKTLTYRRGPRPPVIIVDGCEKRCLFNELLEEGLTGGHNLALSEVGISPVNIDDISEDDIDLAKEAILAECRPLGKKLNYPAQAGCCCR